MNYIPSARCRLACAILAVAGSVLSVEPLILAVGYGLLLLPLILVSRVWESHLRFLLTVVAPVAAMVLLVWPVLIGAPPGQVAGSNPAGAMKFAFLTILRLAIIGGIFQASLLSLRPAQLSATLWQWGIRGDWLIVVLAAVVLGPEMNRRADRIVTAAAARGLLKGRRLWHRVRLLMLSLVPLLAWCLRSALGRADTWHERKLLGRVECASQIQKPGALAVDIPAILLSGSWLVLNVAVRWSSSWSH